MENETTPIKNSGPYYQLPVQAPQPREYITAMPQVQQLSIPGPYLHGYVMGSSPPVGPPKVFDITQVVPQAAPNYGTSSQVYSNTSSPRQNCGSKSAAPVVMLVMYIVGMVTFVTHPVSIALSLHLVKTGRIQKRRSEVLWFSFIELGVWLLCACMSWLYTTDYSYVWYVPYSTQVDYYYWGYIFIIIWFVFSLGFGIPRVIFSWNAAEREEGQGYHEYVSSGSYNGLRISCLITYLVGFIFFIPHVVSIGMSLVMLKKGLIVKKRSAVLACAVIELMGWMSAASLSWLYFDDCWFDYYYYDLECATVYIGWIFIVIWGTLAIAFGIPRVVFTWSGQRVSEFSLAPNGQKYSGLDSVN